MCGFQLAARELGNIQFALELRNIFGLLLALFSSSCGQACSPKVRYHISIKWTRRSLFDQLPDLTASAFGQICSTSDCWPNFCQLLIFWAHCSNLATHLVTLV